MRKNAGLHRLVVVGHDGEHRIGAGRFRAARVLDGVAGRIGSRRGNDADTAVRDFDGGADDSVMLGWRQRRGFAGGLADPDRRGAWLDLELAESCEGRMIVLVFPIEGRRKIRDVARKPKGGMWVRFHLMSRGFFHLAETL